MRSSSGATSSSSSSTRGSAFDKYALERNTLLDAYFRDTKLLEVLQMYVTKLALLYKTKQVLPANPYPSLLLEIRQAEVERAASHSTSSSSTGSPPLLLHEQQTSTSPPRFRLCTSRELLPLSVWGFLPVMERLDGEVLQRSVQRVRELYPLWSLESESNDDDEGYKVAIHDALVGNGVFVSPTDTPFIQVERHVCVSGEQLEKAMAVFARQLVKCLHERSSSMRATASLEPSDPTKSATGMPSSIGCNGICIAAADDSDAEDKGDRSFWSLERVSGNRNVFISAVKTALVSHHSFAITSYDFALQSSGNIDAQSASLFQTTQRFYFHFRCERAGGKSNQSAKNQQQQNRSFLRGSCVLERGVFLDGHGALEIANRIQQITHAASTSSVTGSNANGKDVALKPPPGKQPAAEIRPEMRMSASKNAQVLRANGASLAVVESVMDNIKLTCRSSDSCCHWMRAFARSFSFEVLKTTLGTQVLINFVVESNRDPIPNHAIEAMRSHFSAVGSQVGALLEQARVGSTSSLLTSVEPLLSSLWREIRARLHTKQEDESVDWRVFAESLACVNTLLLVVARVAANDFMRFFHSSLGADSGGSSSPPNNVDAEPDEQMDVIRAIQRAVEDRAYPPVVLFEAVLAQFLVDSCVDVAFESAVMNIVAFHLPPNPFIELSQWIRTFAVRQHVWRVPLDTAASSCASVTTTTTTTTEQCVSIKNTNTGSKLYSSNRSLLECLDGDKIWKAHQWLQRNELFRPRDFQPPKRSYLVQTFHSLLVFHPVVNSTSARTTESASRPAEPVFSPLVQELEFIEHIVVEGREFAQALAFFAAAVTEDLRRLLAARANSKVTILDPWGKTISAVEHPENEDAILHQLLEEATPAKCVLHVRSVCCADRTVLRSDAQRKKASEGAIHVVGKAYLFHHKPTEPAEQAPHPCCVSQLSAFRLLRFGVFFSLDHAQYVVATIANRSVDACSDKNIVVPREEWTPYARHAIAHDDLFLKYELDFGVSTTHHPLVTPFHLTEDHKHDRLRQRLVSHSFILQLFAIEAACRWLLEQLQQEANEPPSRGGKSIAPGSAITSFASMYAWIFPMLVRQLAQTLVPLNDQMRYVDDLDAQIASLQQLGIIMTTLPDGVQAAPGGGGDSHVVNQTSALLDTLRQTWLLVLYVRFSYQRDFFSNYC